MSLPDFDHHEISASQDAYATAKALDDLVVQHDDTRKVALKAVKASLENTGQLSTLNSLLASHQQMAMRMDGQIYRLRWHALLQWVLILLLALALILVAA